MKKLSLSKLLIGLLLLQGCTNNNAAIQVSTNVTQPKSVNVASPTLQKPTNTELPTATATFLPTFTAESTNPYIFQTETGQTNLSFGNITIRFDEGVLKGKSTKVTIISPENLGSYSSTSEGLTVGNGVGVIRPENYGNLLLGLHSGYSHKKPLEGEIFRLFLEYIGGYGENYVLEKLKEIEGSKGVITTPEGLELNVKIVGGVRLQPAESEELRSDPSNVLDIVTKKIGNKYLAIGNAEIFESIKTNGHELLINFCGWGPNQEPTYYRYVLLLNVEEKP
jgi:hypothetical protein